MAAPAFSTTFICWCGHMPARRLPSYSSSPWKPSTISAAMPISTAMLVSLEMRSQARSVARNSESPVEATVS